MMNIHGRRKPALPLAAHRPTVGSMSRRSRTELTFERGAQAYCWRTDRDPIKTNRD